MQRFFKSLDPSDSVPACQQGSTIILTDAHFHLDWTLCAYKVNSFKDLQGIIISGTGILYLALDVTNYVYPMSWHKISDEMVEQCLFYTISLHPHMVHDSMEDTTIFIKHFQESIECVGIDDQHKQQSFREQWHPGCSSEGPIHKATVRNRNSISWFSCLPGKHSLLNSWPCSSCSQDKEGLTMFCMQKSLSKHSYLLCNNISSKDFTCHSQYGKSLF